MKESAKKIPERSHFNEAALTPGTHDENVRILLKQARILMDDIYPSAYKVHSNIVKYIRTAYNADLAKTSSELATIMQIAAAIKGREIQRKG